ncbi:TRANSCRIPTION TERMINATION FACTOR 2-RELATED [Salix purpurea]|uniref:TRANSCRIPTION TERMINATION FACTOR 2-RELATED n=1 Tax=Salix purpurea TaxID=77065 RepID=A0A9Q0ZMG0_SALPP|nr:TRANSCRIPTION TERMINATION FACTOR 2-RELATED [Salix purpurea]
MDAISPIEISSSDSDFNFTDDDEVEVSPVNGRDSASTRTLPDWATAHPTTSRHTGYGGQTQNAHPLKRSYASNGSSSSNVNDLSWMKIHGQPTNGANIRDTSWSTARGDDYEKLSSQQALKRTLPPSLQPSELSNKSNNTVENVSSGGSRDIYGNAYHLAGPSVTNSRGYMRDIYSKRNTDDIMMYENNGSRIPPPSFMHGKSSAQFPGPSEPVYHSMAGDENVAGTDERLVYQAALEDLNQPKVEANLPDGLMSVPLLRHQKIALAWMLQKETRSLHCLGGILADDQGLGKTISMIALVQMQKSLETKPKTEDQCNLKTEALNLDDDDDNGTPVLDKDKQTGESADIKSTPEVGSSIKAITRRRPAAGTLVVCPASVLRQWARELDDKVADGAKLSVLVYHGGNRTRSPDELAKHDVVLTTYSIVTNEVPKQPLVDEDEADDKSGEKHGISSEFSNNKKRKKSSKVSKKRGRKGMDSSSIDCDCGALARVSWSRVILDEAQTIKNHRTQVARACCSLRAKRRWCLSGTPIQNSIDDLYSYFRFLRYDPYAVYKSFYNTIKVPISRNSLHGYKKLQAVLRAIMLRRTKATLIDGQPIINLPPKSICLSKVDFSAEERAFYTRLEADSRSKFKAYAAAGTVNQNYANILLMLLRLRQACDHPLLVKGFNSESVEKDSTKMANQLPREMVVDLLNRLTSALCRVCNDPPEDSVATMCGHVFCNQCVSEYLTGDDNTCPATDCKEQLGSDVVFSEATLRRRISDNFDASSSHSKYDDKSIVLQHEYSSSKIKAVLEVIQSHCKAGSPISEFNGSAGCSETSMAYSNLSTEGPIKAIVFSQWTSMLDLVERSLNQHCIQYRRLDGTMTLSSRDKVTVMLMSLKAGNLGLNMVAACHVILLDLWWNPTTEDQAIDRAHRIGQTRPVTVTRLTIKDTVEDRILALQDEKRKMVASAFGEDQSGGSAARLTVEDLKYLFMV